ncbi:cleavage and polyadenylation specificity factor subunit 7-like [Convolutriloba macropyga]|uniref:cleavage and polyadenylation specificity factor subunit 7-like n=1 Tax=Convolutriloba macropyga TaxID=536237 RepID=UPI003F524DA0
MSDDIDLYSDDIEPTSKKEVQAATTEETDLYNDVLASSNAESKPVAPDEIKAEPQSEPGLTNTSATPTTFSTSTSSYKFGAHGGSTWTRRVSLYIGNLTWWTTNQDLMDAIRELGVMDLLEIKFNENRVNGQSKGFCMAHFASDTSAQRILEMLPKQKIQGQTPLVTPCNKQNLMHFEQKKGNVSSTESVTTTSVQQTPIVNNNMTNNSMASAVAAAASFVPPMFPPIPPAAAAGMVVPPRLPPMMPDIKTSVASAPAFPGMPPFFPPGMPPMPPFPGMMPPFLPPTSGVSGGGPGGISSPKEEKRPETPPLTETEIEEIMSRNRQVSTTAIARALADASKGEYEDASQTLKLAIKLIKQSKVADDSRCQVLITSLEQCLRGITQKFSSESGGGGGGSSSSKSHSSRRKRSSRDASPERSRGEREGRSDRRERERSGDYYKRSRSRDRSSRDEKYERRESKRDREYRR